MQSRNAHPERGVSTLDVGRGLAIVLVVYGHGIAPWFMNAGAHFSDAAFAQWKFGTAFIMPFFFFLSGAGWRRERSLRKTFRQAGALVLIAWTASAAFDALRLLITWLGAAGALAQPVINLDQFAINTVRTALNGYNYSLTALWFLTALAVVRVLAALFSRLGRTALIASAVLVLAASIAAFQADLRDFYQLYKIGVAYVFFLAGYALRAPWRVLAGKRAATAALMLAAGGVTAATFALNGGCAWNAPEQCGANFLNGRFSVSMIFGDFGYLPLFALTAGSGVLFAAALTSLIVGLSRGAGHKLAEWGRASLNLFIVNAIFLELVNPSLSRWLVPHTPADNVAFFAIFFVLNLAANLLAMHGLKRPLHELRSFAIWASGVLVEFAWSKLPAAIVTPGRDRVSQRHE